MTDLGRETSAHLGQSVTETRTAHGRSLSIPGVSLFVSDGQPVCPKACADSLRHASLRQLYSEPLNEEIPEDFKRLLDQLK
jgi:hypothetical protein